MQLTLHTDYALRVLMYVAVQDGVATISEIADRYQISRNHLVKVVHELGQKGYINTERGRGGGMTLAKPANEIRIGDVVRDMEPHFHIVECFNPEHNACILTPSCALKAALAKAHRAFMASLDDYTLADVTKNRATLSQLLSV